MEDKGDMDDMEDKGDMEEIEDIGYLEDMGGEISSRLTDFLPGLHAGQPSSSPVPLVRVTHTQVYHSPTYIGKPSRRRRKQTFLDATL